MVSQDLTLLQLNRGAHNASGKEGFIDNFLLEGDGVILSQTSQCLLFPSKCLCICMPTYFAPTTYHVHHKDLACVKEVHEQNISFCCIEPAWHLCTYTLPRYHSLISINSACLSNGSTLCNALNHRYEAPF